MEPTHAVGRMAKRVGAVVLGLFALLFVIARVDASASSRAGPLLAVSTSTLANFVVHLGTPAWLKQRLARGAILRHPGTDLFPNVHRLRASLPMILEEAQGVLEVATPIHKDQFFSEIADEGWKKFYIKWYGPPDPIALEVCPQTVRLLESMPEVHLAMFSILEPRSVIKPHNGPFRGSLRYHLGLETPNDDRCFIRTGLGSRVEQTYSWRDGEDVMFDDTFIHEVRNETDRRRVILFLDVERPQTRTLGWVNRWLIKHVAPGTTRSNDALEKRSSTRLEDGDNNVQ